MTGLIMYDSMCRAIDAAFRVDEVKNIRDKALALEAYAKQAKNIEAERRATEIRLRAERKAGQLLKTMEQSGERATRGGDKRSKSTGATLKLADLGVSKGQSSRWQKLADVPDEKFEEGLAADRPTTGGIIGANMPEPELASTTPVSREASWLWGWLCEFERVYLGRDPAALLPTPTTEMLDDLRRLAPIVAHWLLEVAEAIRFTDGRTIPATPMSANEDAPASSDGLEIPSFLNRRKADKSTSEIADG